MKVALYINFKIKNMHIKNTAPRALKNKLPTTIIK